MDYQGPVIVSWYKYNSIYFISIHKIFILETVYISMLVTVYFL